MRILTRIIIPTTFTLMPLLPTNTTPAPISLFMHTPMTMITTLQLDHSHGDSEEIVWHSHGWGTKHAHRLDLVTGERPKLPVLITLSIAGGILPDPAALAILLGGAVHRTCRAGPRDRSGVQPRLRPDPRGGGNSSRANWPARAGLAGQRVGAPAAIGDNAADHRDGGLAHGASSPPVRSRAVDLTWAQANSLRRGRPWRVRHLGSFAARSAFGVACSAFTPCLRCLMFWSGYGRWRAFGASLCHWALRSLLIVWDCATRSMPII